MKAELREKINALKSFAWVTSDGRFIGDINNDIIRENPTVIPMHIASLMVGYKYDGCGVWKDIHGDNFEYTNIKDKWGGCNVSGTIDDLFLIPVGMRKSKGKLKLNELNDIINEDAVMAVTSDGWKIVDMFAFESVPWDMTGFHTYAFKEDIIKKCIIGYDNDITYTLY